MNKRFSLVLIILPYMSFAQPDTVYYNDKHLVCTSASATGFEVTGKMNDTAYVVSRYLINPFRLETTNHYKSLEPPVYHGEAISYYKNGDTVRGYYNMNMYTGECREYYDRATRDTLLAVYYQKDGKLHGTLVSYFPNGKVKRRARYAFDKLVQGHQYDEQGNEVDYTPLMTMPEPMYNVDKYIAKHLEYPKEAVRNNIEGEVMLMFTIDKTGKIKDAQVISYTPEILNKEALRVVANMKPWKPAIFNDQPVDMFFTLPISFQMH